MPRTEFSSPVFCPRIDVAIDMGNPFLNRTVDGFLKIGAVAASWVAAEETFNCLQKGKGAPHVECNSNWSCSNPCLHELTQFEGFSPIRLESWRRLTRCRSISKGNFEDALKRMCKEGAYWGTVAGVYVGVEYGMERVRGTRDWKNAMLGGAVTGLLISATSNSNKEKIFKDAITAGAVATAAEFINYLT